VIRLRGPKKELENLLGEFEQRLLAEFQDSNEHRIIDWNFKHIQSFSDEDNQIAGAIMRNDPKTGCADRCTQPCRLSEAIAENSQLGQGFEWARDENISLLRRTEVGNVYRALAIHVSTTLNNLTFTEDEIRLATRSLANRPLNLNHGTPLHFPANRVIDAEFERDAVECLIVVADPLIIDMIEHKQITAVTIEARVRDQKDICVEDDCSTHVKGVVLTGLALLTPGVPPADPMARIVLKDRVLRQPFTHHEPGLPADPMASIVLKENRPVKTKTYLTTGSAKQIAEPRTARKLGLFWSGMFAVMAAFLTMMLAASATDRHEVDAVEAEEIARRHLQTRNLNDVALSRRTEDSSCHSFLFTRGETRFTVKIDKFGKVISYREEKMSETAN